MFDNDANGFFVSQLLFVGYISLAEMKNIFSGSTIKDDKFWQDIFASADLNQDNMVNI